jgi:uncharacterized protein YjcR
MTTTDSSTEDAAPRKRGAPRGNRNAWKHGGRSAAAKAEREAARERVAASLPDPNLLVQIARRHEPAIKRLGWDAELARIESNKTNNSVARDGPRKRGAPKGNRNALKHGFRSGKRREFSSGLRNFLRRLDAMCKLAHVMANGGRVQ